MKLKDRRWRLRSVHNGGLLIAALAIVAVACAPAPAEEPADMAEAEEPAGVTIPELPVPIAVTINHVMVAQIDHASHALWDVEREGGAPETDEDWRELQHHAIQVAGGGTLIALGGTGQADPGYVQLVGWKEYAQQMTDAAVAARMATENQDLAALQAAGDALVDSCESCHQEFKPDLPSEGYLHPHYIGPTEPSN